MNQANVAQTVKQIYSTILGMTTRLWEKTLEINALVAQYDIEAEKADALNQMISEREGLFNGIVTQQTQLEGLLPHLDGTAHPNSLEEIEKAKHLIIIQLDEIINMDKYNQKEIEKLKNLTAQKTSHVTKGKKVINAYNVFPRRKSIFVDFAIKE